MIAFGLLELKVLDINYVLMISRKNADLEAAKSEKRNVNL